MIPVPAFQPVDWHLDVLSDFDNGRTRFGLLNCHRRSRKTTLCLNLLIREAIKNPKSVYGYIAPTYVQGKAIVWNDPNMIQNYLPMAEVNKKNESELLVEFKNKSLFVVKGADKPDSLRGLDFRGLVLDEFSMHKNASIWEEILYPVITQSSDRWAFFPFTPKGRNHAFQYVNDAKDEWKNYKFTVEDTGLIPEGELNKAKEKMPHSLFRQEFFCDFVADDERVLISWEMLDALEKQFYEIDDKRRIIGLDPSEGGDECVSHFIEGGKIIDTLVLKGERDPDKVIGMNLVFAGKNNVNDFAIDSIGIGSGIAHGIQRAGKKVQFINSAQEPIEKDLFANKRAEMWWYVANQIRDRKVFPIQNDLVKQQLTVPRYDTNIRGKIIMEPKQKTRELLKCSPDHADAYVYGIWGLQFVKTQQVQRAINRVRKNRYSGFSGGW